MKRLKNRYIIALTLFLCGAISNRIAAQQVPQQQQQQQQQIKEDFKKEELQSFIKANEKVVAIQQASEQEMIKVIKDEGFTVERFNKLAEAQQNPQKKVEADAKEMGSFNTAAQKIVSMSKAVEGQMQESIKNEGLDVQTYQQIILAYQQSPKVKKAVDDLLPKPTGTPDTTSKENL